MIFTPRGENIDLFLSFMGKYDEIKKYVFKLCIKKRKKNYENLIDLWCRCF